MHESLCRVAEPYMSVQFALQSCDCTTWGLVGLTSDWSTREHLRARPPQKVQIVYHVPTNNNSHFFRLLSACTDTDSLTWYLRCRTVRFLCMTVDDMIAVLEGRGQCVRTKLALSLFNSYLVVSCRDWLRSWFCLTGWVPIKTQTCLAARTGQSSLYRVCPCVASCDSANNWTVDFVLWCTWHSCYYVWLRTASVLEMMNRPMKFPSFATA